MARVLHHAGHRIARRRLPASSANSSPVSRAGMKFATSSIRAAAQPKASCRSVRWPIMEVERVDRLVAGDAGQSEQRAPEHRRDNAVGGILRKALDRGARDAGFVERRRIAAHDHRHGLSCRLDIARTQGIARRPRHDRRASATRRRARPGCRAARCRTSPDGIARLHEPARSPPPARSRSARPRHRRRAAIAGVSDDRFHRASSAPIRPPSQVTGWPMRANSATGPAQQGIHRHRHHHRSRKSHDSLLRRPFLMREKARPAQAPRSTI